MWNERFARFSLILFFFPRGPKGDRTNEDEDENEKEMFSWIRSAQRCQEIISIVLDLFKSKTGCRVLGEISLRLSIDRRRWIGCLSKRA